MAATKEEPAAAADQAKAQAVPGAIHLDNLQGMLNLVFLQSGRFIKETQSGGGTGRMKLGMQRAVPIAAERFHDSLDQLENEVRIAQIVLRRDLALLKQDRKKKLEAAAKQQQEAEKARLAAETKSIESATLKDEMHIDKEPASAQPEAPSTETQPEKKNEPESTPLKKGEDNIPVPINTSAAQAQERDPLFDGTPTTANPADNEFDFDAIFGDSMDTSGDNNNNQNDMMDTSGDMGFNFDEGPSLLRGLEDFAKDSDDGNAGQNPGTADLDMTMPDLPDLNASTETTAPAEQPAPATEKAEEPPAHATTQPPAETTTTTTATNADTANNTTNHTAGDGSTGMMVTNDFDDLFNMDEEYTNPEASAFDDAFFDFGN